MISSLVILNSESLCKKPNGKALIDQRVLAESFDNIKVTILVNGPFELEPKAHILRESNTYLSRRKLYINALSSALFDWVPYDILKINNISREEYNFIYTSSSLPLFEFRKDTFLNSIDSYSELFRSYLKNSFRVRYLLSFFFHSLNEKFNFKKPQRVNFVSHKDLEVLAQRHSLINLINITNGVEFPDNVKVTKKFDVVFFGNFEYLPNYQALMIISDKILPVVKQIDPHITFSVFGYGTPSGISSDIRVLGDVTNVSETLAEYSMFVFPLVTGAGVKNKILEAAACQLAIIGTPKAFEGLEKFQHGKHVFLHETPHAIAQQIIALKNNQSVREGVAVAARELVEASYSWETKTAQYHAIFRRMVS